MAKGLRSSTKKANKSKLRSKVFGPVEEARKERLSAKLLDLASHSRPKSGADNSLREDERGVGPTREGEPEPDILSDNDMDVDQAKDSASTNNATSTSAGRIQKKRRGKARAGMVFPVYKKGRRVGPRLSTRERKKSLKP